MQLLRRILREAEETLEKLTAIKKRLHDEYEVQIELAEGQNIGAKKRKVLAGLAIEEREQLRNIDKFLRSTLFPSTKRIQATADGDADEEENTNENGGGGDKDAEKTTDEQTNPTEKEKPADKEPEDETTILVTEEPPVTAREPSPEPVRGNFKK